MKNLITITLLLLSLNSFSQDWGLIKKHQPLEFAGVVVHGDTIGIDTASMYNIIGSYLEVDTTDDGRFFLKPSPKNGLDSVTGDFYVAGNLLADSIKGNYAKLDSLSGSGIFISIDANGNLYKNNINDSVQSYISDSVHWEATSTYLKIPKTTLDSVYIGSSSGAAKSEYTSLQVGGQFNKTPTPFVITVNDYNAKNGNTVLVSSTGNLESIINCAVGTEITFTLNAGAAMQIDPTDFTTNSQTIRTPLGAILNLDAFDVIKVICTSPDNFNVSYQSGDNQ